MKPTLNQILLAVFVGFIGLTGCSSADPKPIHSFTSGAYTVEVLTPDGILKSGDNQILIQVISEGAFLPISSGELMFSMPAMGSMPYMERQTIFSSGSGQNELSGVLKFEMGGSWTGHVQVEAEGNMLTSSFPMRVDG